MPGVREDQETDYLVVLEERISRAVELVTALRRENRELAEQVQAANAERDQARAEAQSVLAQAQKGSQEIEELRTERKRVRTRIEKLLGQMDLLSGT
jgi:FtsZ-binding cell division protein ZapB